MDDLFVTADVIADHLYQFHKDWYNTIFQELLEIKKDTTEVYEKIIKEIE